MNKSYTIAGVGVCLGKTPGFEALAESVIGGTEISKTNLTDSLSHAVREALQYTSLNNLCVISDAPIGSDLPNGLAPCAIKVCGGIREMLENAPENVILLSRRDNGWLAVALTQEESGFARLEITDDGNAAGNDGLPELILSALEIRYTLRLDDRDDLYRFWDSGDGRKKELYCGGLRLLLSEPRVPVRRNYSTKKCLLPVVFTTVEEAVSKLTALKQADDLGAAMASLLSGLSGRSALTNTVVLVADSFESLEADVDDLLKQADHLLDEGFVWKRRSGSVYIRRSCANPQVVFMNPPASMFNAKAF